MTNEEFQKLMKLKKEFECGCKLPQNGNVTVFDLLSYETNDRFLLDVDRKGRIELNKYKIQNRYAKTKLPLVRIDIDSPPHINPDGEKLSRNHIHIFRETEVDTGNLPWAYDLENFSGLEYDKEHSTFMDVFIAFCEYCNISTENIQGVI